MTTQEKFMNRCLELAAKGLPSAFPNPSVGAVLVHQNKIIGEGFTSPFGGPHGEVNCINSVKEENHQLISDSTLFVSLEPCSHTGKTPPCADLILSHSISKVVIGCVDTFSEVAGKGIDRLKKNGVEVTVGILEENCRELNKRFFTFYEKNRPHIILKWAQTQDGFIAPEKQNHNQQRWITGEKSNQFTHSLRAMEGAILVGKNTVEADNPSLTTRNYPGKNPMRIVIDKDLTLWENKKQYSIFSQESSTLIFNQIKNFENETNQGIKLDFTQHVPVQICQALVEKGIQSLIVEGGTATLYSFIEANLWDEAFVLEGNKTFGKGIAGPSFEFKTGIKTQLGKDVLFHSKNPRL